MSENYVSKKFTRLSGKTVIITGLFAIAVCASWSLLHACEEDTPHLPTAVKQMALTSATASLHLEGDDQSAEVATSTISEAFGHLIVRNLDNPGFKFDIQKVIVGMQDELAGKPSPLSDEQYEQAVLSVQEKVFTNMADDNLKKAEAFLQQNANASGVIELIPGKLQYKVVTPGTGEEVQSHSTPLIHYTGRYIDGTVFGSSKETDEPISLPLDQTIPGFGKGLLGMKEGEERILYIHPDLGYGVMGQLPPNSLLIFDVELLKANTEESGPDSANPDKTSSPK